MLLGNAAQAETRLRCQLEQGGQHFDLEFAPVLDPYTVVSVEINHPFRFKAVVVGDASSAPALQKFVM